MNKFLKTTILLLAVTANTQAGKASFNPIKYVANHKTRSILAFIALANLIERCFSDKKFPSIKDELKNSAKSGTIEACAEFIGNFFLFPSEKGYNRLFR
jgi:hypothetical protein